MTLRGVHEVHHVVKPDMRPRCSLCLREANKELCCWFNTEGLALDEKLFLDVLVRSQAACHGMLRWLARRALHIRSLQIHVGTVRHLTACVC